MAGTDLNSLAATALRWPVHREPKGLVLIVGGSSGIGLALAETFAAQGYDLLLVARSPDRLTAEAARVAQKYLIAAETLALDATRPDAPARIAAVIELRRARLAHAVITLGVWQSGVLLGAEAASLREAAEINVVAPHALMRTLVPLLQPKGGLLVVGSLAGCLPLPQFAVYAAAKAQLHAHVLSLRQELYGTGLHICLLAPGIVATEFIGGAKGIWALAIALFASNPRAVAHAGVLGLQTNVPVIVPGVFWRLIWFGVRLQPGRLLALWTRVVARATQHNPTAHARGA